MSDANVGRVQDTIDNNQTIYEERSDRITINRLDFKIFNHSSFRILEKINIYLLLNKYKIYHTHTHKYFKKIPFAACLKYLNYERRMFMTDFGG